MDSTQNQFKRSALYYPTIRIPSGQWLKQTLLYWDEVGSIVPQGYDGKWLITNSPILEYLLSEELFHPFDPRQIESEWQLANELASELKKIIESEHYQKSLPEISKRIFDSSIHRDKVFDLVLNHLLEKSLVKDKSPEGERKEDWVFFERTTALLYMSLLAKYLARGDNRNNIITTPGTNWPEYQHLLFIQTPSMDNEMGIEVRVRNWLPIPYEHISIQDIVAFKRKRQDELLPLQLLMLDFEQQLRKAESLEEAQQSAYKFDLERRKGVRDLKASLKDAKIETRWGSLNTLIGVTPPPLVGFFASEIAKTIQTANPILIGVASFGLTASIMLKAYYVSRQNGVNEKLRNSPYSYLFHAVQKNIIPG